jgi:hypothetical protein
MQSEISAQDAAAALAQVDDARAAMRRAIRAHRGHYHLWIWGVAWVVMPLLARTYGDRAAPWFGGVCFVAGMISSLVGFLQGRQVKQPVNQRFVIAIGALIAFAVIFMFVLQPQPTLKSIYAYTCLVVLQAYVIAGLWTDTYLLWLGIIVTVLVLVGYFLLPQLFWPWMAAFGGGSLIASGFYVRYFWR